MLKWTSGAAPHLPVRRPRLLHLLRRRRSIAEALGEDKTFKFGRILARRSWNSSTLSTLRGTSGDSKSHSSISGLLTEAPSNVAMKIRYFVNMTSRQDGYRWKFNSDRTKQQNDEDAKNSRKAEGLIYNGTCGAFGMFNRANKPPKLR